MIRIVYWRAGIQDERYFKTTDYLIEWLNNQMKIEPITITKIDIEGLV